MEIPPGRSCTIAAGTRIDFGDGVNGGAAGTIQL